jgi:hypothetical protein
MRKEIGRGVILGVVDERVPEMVQTPKSSEILGKHRIFCSTWKMCPASSYTKTFVTKAKIRFDYKTRQ